MRRYRVVPSDRSLQGGDLGYFGPGEMQKPFEERGFLREPRFVVATARLSSAVAWCLCGSWIQGDW